MIVFYVLVWLGMSVAQTIGAALAANAAAPDPVASRGLMPTTQDRALVETAISRANLILSLSPTRHRLRASWRTAGPTDRAVPVYLVEVPPNATSTLAAVPRGCMCVFVNPFLLANWIKTHSEGLGRLSLDTTNLLIFMLLHEVGHIHNGSAAGEFSNGELSQLNIEPSLAKANEEQADEYAVGLVKQHVKQLSKESLVANWVAIELTKLSWNMQAYRTLDEIGASSTGKRSVFFDQSYSHPNLAWRMLRSNYLIQESPETKRLLDLFEEARQRGVEQKSLYPRK